MAPKQQLEKNAWEWARTTSPDCVTNQHVETVYRLHLKPCEVSACKKNCSGNPHCLNGLGEKKWLNNDDPLTCNVNPDSLKRGETGLVGLENLGATCYINTFLQVWFHNREFRTAVLLWKDPDTEANGSFDQVTSLIDPMPTSPCGNLQLVFSQLAFSQRCSFAPVNFISSLEIDTNDQQDAQEFSKLFMALLEKDPVMCHVIQQQFMGKYEYLTCCSGCGSEVSREDSFYELLLNICGHKELSECLKEFFQEQVLNGDNQYYCERCASKHDATRRIRLKSLPPVLNFQLARFVFENGRKKKLNSYITFPEVLDMTDYLHPTQDMVPVYELIAVLIHRGPSASSGHYIAVIKDPVTGTTYKFNDTEVEKEKKFSLANEEESDGGKPKEKPRAAKGCQLSRSAYMLVYRLRSLSADVSMPEVSREDLPPRVQEFLRCDDENFESQLQEQSDEQLRCVAEYYMRKAEVEALYTKMAAVHDSHNFESCEWISSEWLVKWLSVSCDCDVPPIDNSRLRCRHDRLNPWCVSGAKLISTEIADKLFSTFHGGIRLPFRDSMCRDCVISGCFVAYHKAQIDRLSADISEMAISPSNPNVCLEDCYWVTRMSLRRWSAVAKQSFERTAGCAVVMADDTAKSLATNDANSVTFKAVIETANDDNCRPPVEPVDLDNKVSSTQLDVATADSNACQSTDDEDDRVLFNGDIVCSEHGGLRTDVWSRCLLVSSNNWRRLVENLAADEFIEMSATQCICSLCESSNIAEKNLVDARRKLACNQRNQLSDLYYGRNRPSANCSCLYLVSSDFVNDWKAFIRDPAKCSTVEEVNNRRLLCCHGKLCAELPSTICWENNSASAKMVYVREDEWMIIQQLFKVDVELRRETVVDDVGQSNVILVPEMCNKCFAERLQAEYLAQTFYENATIYISKVDEVDRTIAHGVESSSAAVTGLSASSTSFSSTLTPEDYINVTDEQNAESANKRKLNGSSDDVETKVRKLGIMTATANDVQPTRRSTRVKHSKNSSKQFTVSSSMALRELKMKVAREYEVLKTDQHLFFDGQELLDEDATLQTLGIPQGAHLLLKIDESPSDQSSVDSLDVIASNQRIEKGFKGTLLSI